MSRLGALPAVGRQPLRLTVWRREEKRGRAGRLHALGLGPGRLVRVCEAAHPTLVLGSTQPMSHVDQGAARRAGLDVARRRSGGGAVLVEPGALFWVDVSLPAGDPLWDEDVGRAFWWLGEAWAAALGDLGVPGAAVHRGPLVASRWSAMVCFAGLGPGEVTVEGRKVVGMAQRRTRQGSVFQCALPLRWETERLLSVLALQVDERAAAVEELSERASAVPGVTATEMAEALIAHLP